MFLRKPLAFTLFFELLEFMFDHPSQPFHFQSTNVAHQQLSNFPINIIIIIVILLKVQRYDTKYQMLVHCFPTVVQPNSLEVKVLTVSVSQHVNEIINFLFTAQDGTLIPAGHRMFNSRIPTQSYFSPQVTSLVVVIEVEIQMYVIYYVLFRKILKVNEESRIGDGKI